MRLAPTSTSAILGSLVAFSAVAPVHGGVNIISRDTELSASGRCGPGDTTCTPGTDGVLIGQSTASQRLSFGNNFSLDVDYFGESDASQDASFTRQGLSVDAGAGTVFLDGAAASLFTLQFSVFTPQQMLLTDSMGHHNTAYTQLVQLQGPAGILFSDTLGGGSLSAVLSTGVYTLLVQATAQETAQTVDQGDSDAETSAKLQFVSVPLPGSLGLALGGMLLLALTCRRSLA